jgi:L-serine dehydratase
LQSVVEIFRIGYGPSSSHTMGPARAAGIYRLKHPACMLFRVELLGSLAATGQGHLTDKAVRESLKPATAEIIWKPDVIMPRHPNAIRFTAMMPGGEELDPWIVYSTGGGSLEDGKGALGVPESVYTLKNMDQVLLWCRESGKQIWELVEEVEGSSVMDHLELVWKVMQEALARGLEEEGVLPGGLGIPRKAHSYFVKSLGYTESLKRRAQLFSYALAVAEENAGGGKIVTAPTCGSCGVLPAVLFYLKQYHNFNEKRIHRALATAGLIAAIVKRNASISGAEVGCQGEIGTACAMTAGAAVQLFGGSPAQVEYAAEMGLEHHLGLTCDPVAGLVQVPCIERNAFAASRALDADAYSTLSDGVHRISFDKVVRTMLKTGRDLPALYRETSGGGLAID